MVFNTVFTAFSAVLFFTAVLHPVFVSSFSSAASVWKFGAVCGDEVSDAAGISSSEGTVFK